MGQCDVMSFFIFSFQSKNLYKVLAESKLMENLLEVLFCVSYILVDNAVKFFIITAEENPLEHQSTQCSLVVLSD